MKTVKRWSEGILPSKTVHALHEYIHDTHKRASRGELSIGEPKKHGVWEFDFTALLTKPKWTEHRSQHYS